MKNIIIKPESYRTHVACLGMTGSGKTGLCVSLLEDLALQGVPVLAIDPKGDLTNMALRFPGLSAKEFAPWVEGDDPGRVADGWRRGIVASGRDPENIAKLHANNPVEIYSPGSRSAIPLNVLSGLQAPTGTMEDEDRAELAMAASVAVLGLAGEKRVTSGSSSAILLSLILGHCWDHDEDPTLGRLSVYLDKPPFDYIGVSQVDAFLPRGRRLALSQKINSLLASPTFGTWGLGADLNMDNLLWDKQGRPKTSIAYLAHLSDEQRMFATALLLNAAVGWMRQQPGTGDLRAVIYLDEIAGLCPPYPKNPPTKQPLMTLFKQARAFGIGVFVATQNPRDMDYVALSNAGVWLVGKLSTARDRHKVMEGMKSSGGADNIDKDTIATLGKREFLEKNTPEKRIAVGKSTHAYCYLRGPLTKPDLHLLCGTKKGEGLPSPTSGAFLPVPPSLPGLTNLFVPPRGKKQPRYVQQVLVVDVRCQFRDRASGINVRVEGQRHVNITKKSDMPDLAVGRGVERDTDTEPHPNATFSPLPPCLSSVKDVRGVVQAAKQDWRIDSSLALYRHRGLRMFSTYGEPRSAFEDRCYEVAMDRAESDNKAGTGRVAQLTPKLVAIGLAIQAQREAIEKSETKYAGASICLFFSCILPVGAKAREKELNAVNKRREIRENGARRIEELECQLIELNDHLARAEPEALAEAAVLEVEEYAVFARASDIEISGMAVVWVEEQLNND